MDNYLCNDINNPTYLFHGSPKKLEVIEKRQSHDSNGNIENIDNAVFLTSSFIMASAYAFKDTIKEMSSNLDWEFEISYDSVNNQPNIVFKNVNINDDLVGYIYVFNFNNKYEHTTSSSQYKCHEDITPIDVIKIQFKDFKKFYKIIN